MTAASPSSPGASRAEYTRRMHRVLAYIDRHLAEPIDVAALADVAHFSRYHFHRVFAAWMGETAGEYLWRRRIETAAVMLRSQPRLPVLQAALAVGFGSCEAFSRAFRQRFGMSATAWRQAQQQARGLSNLDQDSAASCGDHGGHPFPGDAMPVQLIDLPATTVAYLRHWGPYGTPILRFWHATALPWMRGASLLGRTSYGIAHDDPDVTDPARCRYDAAVEVPAHHLPAPPADVAHLPGGRYAVLPFWGRNADIGKAWRGLLRDWLPDSGLQLDPRPCLERYSAQHPADPAMGFFACDICVPVAPLWESV